VLPRLAQDWQGRAEFVRDFDGQDGERCFGGLLAAEELRDGTDDAGGAFV
jgi:hypothetical protein